jgi:hypothetical protein
MSVSGLHQSSRSPLSAFKGSNINFNTALQTPSLLLTESREKVSIEPPIQKRPSTISSSLSSVITSSKSHRLSNIMSTLNNELLIPTSIPSVIINTPSLDDVSENPQNQNRLSTVSILSSNIEPAIPSTSSKSSESCLDVSANPQNQNRFSSGSALSSSTSKNINVEQPSKSSSFNLIPNQSSNLNVQSFDICDSNVIHW